MQRQNLSTKTPVATDFDLPNEINSNREEILKQMILDCRKMFVSEETEECCGIWLLIDDSDLNEVLVEQSDPDCVFVLTSKRYFIVCYDETFQKVVSFKETPLASVDKVEVGPNPSSPLGSSLTLRIHYIKDEQTSGYYHQFRGTNVQVFNNTTVMFLKDLEQINDYLRTTGQMIVSILNHYAQKSLNLNEKTLNSIEINGMNSLRDDVEPLQRRMSFTATDTPPLSVVASSNRPTIDKIRNFGSRFSSMVSRQAAPTLTKLTTQAKLIPINETVSSLLKVIGESPSLIRSNPNARNPLDDGRISPTPESNRKRLLQEKFEERKKDLSSNSCQTKCFLFPSPDLTIFYIPNE